MTSEQQNRRISNRRISKEMETDNRKRSQVQGSPFRVTFVHRWLQVQAALFSAAYTQHPSTVLFLFGLTLSTDESKVQIGPEPINLEP